MASKLKKIYPLAKYKRPHYHNLFQCRTPLLAISSRRKQLENRLLFLRNPTDTFASGRPSTLLSRSPTRSVSSFSRPLPLRCFSPPKFSIGVAPVATFAVFRPLLVEKREPPYRCSNLFKYRSVISPGLLHSIMTVVLLFIVI